MGDSQSCKDIVESNNVKNFQESCIKSAYAPACVTLGNIYIDIADYKNAIKYYELGIKFGEVEGYYFFGEFVY